MGEWINFRELRKSLSFEKVLGSYGVEVKKKGPGNRHIGFCPLPTHRGKKKSPSFSAKLDYGVWQCFGCKASGNVLDFAIQMEGKDPDNRQDLREVALKLRGLFGIEAGSKPSSARTAGPPATKPNGAPRKKLPVVVNSPLDFELKDLDREHPYLKGRGFTAETIEHFGLGFCNRGLMKGRVVIPIHNTDGDLVGYAGRLVDDNAIDEKNPKYLFPGPRERNGKLLEFHKSLLAYNAHRLTWPMEDLIVVEGFPACWWLTQWGYTNVVALMGSSCSEEQARLIVSGIVPDGRVWIFADADDGGDKCAASALTQIVPHRFCRWVKLSNGQPTDCTPGDLAQLLWSV